MNIVRDLCVISIILCLTAVYGDKPMRQGLLQDKAMNLLSNYLTDEMTEGMVLMYQGELHELSHICYDFALGTNIDGKFTAEAHYAVTSSGEIYKLNIIGNQWELIKQRRQ